jgi:hypothetical protein
MYIPISNSQGGDEDISSFDEDEAGGPSNCDLDIRARVNFLYRKVWCLKSEIQCLSCRELYFDAAI